MDIKVTGFRVDNYIWIGNSKVRLMKDYTKYTQIDNYWWMKNKLSFLL